jgi:hypothetical protein
MSIRVKDFDTILKRENLANPNNPVLVDEIINNLLPCNLIPQHLPVRRRLGACLVYQWAKHSFIKI